MKNLQAPKMDIKLNMAINTQDCLDYIITAQDKLYILMLKMYYPILKKYTEKH